MQKKPSILNIVIIIIGIIVLVYGLTQKSESTIIANEIGEKMVQADVDKVESKNNGKLVVVSGNISASGELKDDYFNITKHTIKLKRVVETYQWYEDCSAECTYVKIWSEALINSAKYDDAHKNPDSKQYSSEEYVENRTALGDYVLPGKLVDDLHYDTVMGPDEMISNYDGHYNLLGEYITNVVNMDGANIGDFRIHYEYVKDKEVTVVAKQAGSTFEPYYTDKNKEVFDIKEGQQTIEEYLANMKKNNSVFGIVMVIIGSLFIFFGIGAIIFDVLKEKKKQK